MIKKLIKNAFRSLGYELLKVSSHKHDGTADVGGVSLDDFLAKTEGMTTAEEAHKLFQLAKEVQEGCIVEVGSYRGRSSVALGLGAREGNGAPVYAVDPHEFFEGPLGGSFGPEDRGAFYSAMLSTKCYREVRLINLPSTTVAPNWIQPVALLWIDGDHSYEGVKSDFEVWQPHLTDKAIVAFDDSLNQQEGPYRLLQELYRESLLRQVEIVGKITVCQVVS